MRPCRCDRCARPGRYRTGDCWECWLYHNRSDYRKLWDGEVRPARVAAGKPAAVLRPLPCVQLGTVVRRSGCGNCRRDDVRRCDAGHGDVTQNGRCETCPDYEAD